MDTNNTTPNPNEQPVVNKDTVTPAIEDESTTKYEGVLANYKEGINPPTPTTTTTTTTTSETPVAPVAPVAPIVTTAPTVSDYSDPEIAKQKLQEILNTPVDDIPAENGIPTEVNPSPKNSPLRILFLISLIIFLGVISAVAYYMIKGTDTNSTATPTTAPIVTEVQLEEIIPTQTSTTSGTAASICTLNDVEYQIGEAFNAADNCNVCTCTDDLTITCTEKVCAATTSATPTKVAVTVTPIQ